MKKKLFSRLSMFLAGILLFVSVMGFYPNLSVYAADDREVQFNEAVNASRQVVSTIESNGVDMKQLTSIARKGEAFFDMSLEEMSEAFEIPENYVRSLPVEKTRSIQDDYQLILLLQLGTIYNGAKENQSRGMSNQNNSFEDEIKFQFISHYIDGTGGIDMFMTPYGYESWNMAQWVTDMDRNVFKQVIKSVEKTNELTDIAELSKQIYDKGSIGWDLFKLRAGSVDDALAFGFERLSDTMYDEMGNKQFDYNDLVLMASKTLPYSDTMSEFQEMFLENVSTQYEYLDDLAKTLIVASISMLLFASNPILGVAVTFAFTLIFSAIDLYQRLNLTYLGLTRNARVAERVCDYMEYEGYW